MKIELKKYEKSIDLENFVEFSSFYRRNISIGDLGFRYSGKPNTIKRTEEQMLENKKIAFTVPVYAEFDKFENLNDLFIKDEASNLNEWDIGIVGFLIYTRDFLRKNLEYQRISRKGKFSPKRKDEMVEHVACKLKELRNYLCLSYIAVDCDTGKDLGIVFVKKDFDREKIINSIKNELIESNFIDENQEVEIVLEKDLEDELFYLKKDFSWTL